MSSQHHIFRFHVGDRADFDEWAQIMEGEPGGDQWKYENLHKLRVYSLTWLVNNHLSRYFQKFEKYTPHPQYPDFDTQERGKEGPVEGSVSVDALA